ncbi:flagellar biosynthesis protein FlgC [Halobacillus halophilus]|uniref:Flagellar basal body rod protein n=1 Tax=Halobacillus halophilus (strain ATCC 35676 / DSM 2266 / JCM 20832 / KCTC 3685 / LMG 17431 / NBRC 102448 / NCIMB 2269) TaxID=866895 RepID=I0JS04_HALH3|nr:flagellar hook-basal body protein [Halobacillus halophilus]ASF40874.1 flagellar biosynthesis protein FlgC [Halobacillus halophilus]CCG46925.1 flagellar basal body rod protein [Halobacillus halophilus DSM 2266]
MLRGFYTAASGMLANQRMQETLSNNMSNVNTPGYKADQGTMRAFPELLIEQMGSRKLPGSASSRNIPVQHPVGSLNTGVYMQEAVPAFTQGDLRETGVATDLALLQRNVPDESGSVFFDVQNEAGEPRYTRNGNFTVDGEGFLTTNQGNYVLDQSGNPIETNRMEFDVSEEGIITVDGQDIPLGLSYSSAAEDMVKEGEGLYRLGEDGTQLIEARGDNTVEVDVKQNFLESSNVNSARTMTEMMNTYRSFEMNQRVLKAYDQSMQKTVTEIARLR